MACAGQLSRLPTSVLALAVTLLPGEISRLPTTIEGRRQAPLGGEALLSCSPSPSHRQRLEVPNGPPDLRQQLRRFIAVLKIMAVTRLSVDSVATMEVEANAPTCLAKHVPVLTLPVSGWHHRVHKGSEEDPHGTSLPHVGRFCPRTRLPASG